MSEPYVNRSGLKPLGHAVLVKPYQPERKAGLIVVPDTASQDSMIEQRAIVVEVGPACWPNEPARAKAGDKVMLARYAGHFAKGTLDGEQYRFVNERDIFAAITGEAEQ